MTAFKLAVAAASAALLLLSVSHADGQDKAKLAKIYAQIKIGDKVVVYSG